MQADALLPKPVSRTRSEPLDDDERLVTARDAADDAGGVTLMTLWRWQRDPRVRFPPPDVVINGRRYWRRGSLRAWKARHHYAA